MKLLFTVLIIVQFRRRGIIWGMRLGAFHARALVLLARQPIYMSMYLVCVSCAEACLPALTCKDRAQQSSLQGSGWSLTCH